MLPFVIATCSLLAQAQAAPDGERPSVVFLPGASLSPPLVAHYQEPRFGLRKEIGTSRMKLDIGDAIDLVEFRASGDEKELIRAGVDFFTFALTSNWQGHRLQVDAVDGFFGGHLAYIAPEGFQPLTLRFRILHLSAHFVDGHYDNLAGGWIDGRNPIPFSKDFGEFLANYSWRWGSWSMAVYSGVGYATLVRPAIIKRFSTLHGLQAHTGDEVLQAFGRPLVFYAADDFTLVGIPAYVGSNNLEFGIKLGEWSGRGVKLYLSYYSGLSVFSEYYNVRWDQWGAGFAFDVW